MFDLSQKYTYVLSRHAYSKLKERKDDNQKSSEDLKGTLQVQKLLLRIAYRREIAWRISNEFRDC